MYVQKITLEIKSEYSTDLLTDEFYWLMTMYRKSGQVQVQGGLNTQCVKGNTIMAWVYTLEKSSLSRKNNSALVNQQIRKLETLAGSKLRRKIMGQEYAGLDSVCTCSGSSGYTLTALLMSRDSALQCNDCNRSVPLYRIPAFPSGDHAALIQWHLSSLYLNGIETLNLDREDFPEIPDSLNQALNRQADEIIRHITSSTGKKVRKLASSAGGSGDVEENAGFLEMTE